MDSLFVILGLCGLVAGGEALVRGAVALAFRAGLSPMVIGLTLVGFGTSTPELVTSLQAALAAAPGIALGNVVGSNIANILLILGLAALISPVAVTRRALHRDGAVLMLATLAGLAVVLSGRAGPGAGLALLAGLAVYLWLTLRAERGGGPAAEIHAAEAALLAPETAAAPGGAAAPAWRAALMLAGGLALTLGAARLLVLGAVGLAEAAGLSEAVIGVSIVAIGTSMPELVTSVVAARRGQGAVALGNVIGSNIFNILGILGATALIAPLAVPAGIARFDIWVMLAASLILWPVARSGWRIARVEGAALLAGYALYLGVLLAGAV